MAYAEGILGVALDVSDGAHVRRIELRMGALHGIVLDSLQFCFQLAAQDTPAADAQLAMTTIPVRVRCRACDRESQVGLPPFACGACGAFDVAVVAGEEVQVDAVEVDEGWIRRPDRASSDAVNAFAQEHLREHAQAPLEH
jgi:hydrogenase nickel incorporation protein HypA/HybF